MISLSKLSPKELELLAQSKFGDLTAKDVPEDWREQIERDLKDRGVLADEMEDDYWG